MLLGEEEFRERGSVVPRALSSIPRRKGVNESSDLLQIKLVLRPNGGTPQISLVVLVEPIHRSHRCYPRGV